MPSSLRSPQQDKLREVLIDARKNAKLTQAELAVRLSRPQSFVAKYELGERRIDVVEFVAVARAIGLEATGLLTTYLAACEAGGL
ncbi:multiprotein-bridging factor 1 family protein [Sphingomonas sp. IC081]|uniref:helix-turn-helix domain-containing protein n=1 Tax=Sphingomonas sp. IC081 TaxID=304378 RepID=UPI0011571ECE|nr:helix-turn-helix transcriptional regulator [Sphingomonas sp. IC081]QDK31737.1 XRE family transcriptional regulator [Sphingomonas sp. IC081]